ncbi:DUF6801 domain-containing protein [Amycolatopsis pigmentata]|uniref:DUF6801 domain-containing protein n=1 Tax=Amycolatopsis pigmentata TaxID=450801 RepID=A0ABW5G0B1_9PSEU
MINTLMRIARIGTTVTVMTIGMGMWVTGSAAANPGGVTLHYSCSLPPFPVQIALTGQVTWNAPESLPVGRATPAYDFDITATVDASATRLAQFVGVAAAEGTVDGAVVVRAPEGDIPVSKSESVPLIPIPASGPIIIHATGTTPSLVFHRPGLVTIVLNPVLAVHMDLKSADGSPAPISHADVSCALDPGQNGSVASIEIAPAAAGPTPARTSTTAPPTPTRSESAPAPTTSITPAYAIAKAGDRVSPGRGPDWWLIGGGLALIAGVVGGVRWLMRRRASGGR